MPIWRRIPVIDDNGYIVFESGAILLYLADKYGKFIPDDKEVGGLDDLQAWMQRMMSRDGVKKGLDVPVPQEELTKAFTENPDEIIKDVRENLIRKV